MRILLDDEELPWDVAWGIVTSTFFFTNHTVLPVSNVIDVSSGGVLKNFHFTGSSGGNEIASRLEHITHTLQKWPIPLMEHLLPRHIQIIYDIVRCLTVIVTVMTLTEIS